MTDEYADDLDIGPMPPKETYRITCHIREVRRGEPTPLSDDDLPPECESVELLRKLVEDVNPITEVREPYRWEERAPLWCYYCHAVDDGDQYESGIVTHADNCPWANARRWLDARG